MVMTGSLSIVLKECLLRAGFLWNSDPLLSDAIKRWREKQWRVDREMEVKRQTEGSLPEDRPRLTERTPCDNGGRDWNSGICKLRNAKNCQ